MVPESAGANPGADDALKWLVRLATCVAALPCQAQLAEPVTTPGNTCVCTDGRAFRIGASVFGRDSSRIQITGFKSQGEDLGGRPLCRTVNLTGQTITEERSLSKNPYLLRSTIKRGVIYDICATGIRFVEPKSKYDLYSEDWAVIPVPEAGESKQPSAEDSAAAGNLTGRDLIRLIRPVGPADNEFDDHDIKEGAWVVVRHRVIAVDASAFYIGSTPVLTTGRPAGFELAAGTLGRVEKRSGHRTEDLWEVNVRPDSSPPSFWRRLFNPSARDLSRRTVLIRGEDLLEINHYLDVYGVEATRSRESGTDALRETTYEAVVGAYAPAHLPLTANLANAREEQAERAIAAAARRLVLRLKPGFPAIKDTTLILERQSQGTAQRALAAHQLRRQCFVRFESAVSGCELQVEAAEVRVYQPEDTCQTPNDYYAIDVVMRLGTESSATRGDVVCRFPWTAINAQIVAEAEAILSAGFEIRHQGTK